MGGTGDPPVAAGNLPVAVPSLLAPVPIPTLDFGRWNLDLPIKLSHVATDVRRWTSIRSDLKFAILESELAPLHSGPAPLRLQPVHRQSLLSLLKARKAFSACVPLNLPIKPSHVATDSLPRCLRAGAWVRRWMPPSSTCSFPFAILSRRKAFTGLSRFGKSRLHEGLYRLMKPCEAIPSFSRPEVASI
jgi:hypothetical protein